MSIQLSAKVESLERQLADLERRFVGAIGTCQDLCGIVASLEKRIEQMEQARKPGPKPKDGENG